MKLLQLLEKLSLKNITWLKPNFEHEWEEAEMYLGAKLSVKKKIFFKNKKDYFQKIQAGKEIELSNEQLEKLENYTSDAEAFENLEQEKKERVVDLFKKGKVELPIVLELDKNLYLLSGNTRLTYAIKKNYKPMVWFIVL